MDFFKTSDARFRTPVFNDCVKSAFSKQTNMPSVNSCVVLDSYPFPIKREMEQFPNTKFFQPPPFLVGGFVGSKICENKNGSINYSNLLGQIFNAVTSLAPICTPSKSFEQENWRKKPDLFTKSYAKVTSQSKSDILPPPSVVISSPTAVTVTQQTVLPVSSPATMPSQQEKKLSTLSSPIACRTVSESSETSWASVDPAEERDVLLSNPWLSNIVVCVSDSEDESDSDWDCVEDFQSENGEVICDFKWNGDSLSPISSPVSRTPPTPAAALDDYDSDESDGVLISCGQGYVVDDEEEAKERRLSEERIHDANRRWDKNLLMTVDETDGIHQNTTQSKKVSGGKLLDPFFLPFTIFFLSFIIRSVSQPTVNLFAFDQCSHGSMLIELLVKAIGRD